MCSPKLISSKLPGNLFQVALQHCKKAYCSFNEWALPMLSCESWMFVKEKPRKKNDARNYLQRSCFSSVIKHFLFSIWEECYFSWNMLKTFLSSKIADAWLWMKPKLFFREKKSKLEKRWQYKDVFQVWYEKNNTRSFISPNKLQVLKNVLLLNFLTHIQLSCF